MSYRTEERIVTGLRENVIVGASCDGCEKELMDGKAMSPRILELKLIGGYAMFFDDSDVRAIFCKACAEKLLATFPGLQKAMKEQEPRTEITVARNSRVSVPMVPNFIKLDGNFQALSAFTELQLRAIGEAWTERLVERAAEQRRDGVGTRP